MKISVHIIGLAMILLGCGSCTHQIEDIEPPSPQTESYVIDYGVGAVSGTTRAYADDLPANERISSLQYLLYDADGNLLKIRNIPDIGIETQWPLRRGDTHEGGNMTWAQRLALRDTLMDSRSYTAVFVANASSDLFDGEEVLIYQTDDQANSLTLDQLHLKLPSVRFEDNDMFYLCVKDIPAQTETSPGIIDRDHPFDCPIQLKRIVSRTDIRRFDYVGSEDPQQAYRSYFSQRVTDDLYPTIETTFLNQNVSDFLRRITSEVGNKIVGDVNLTAQFIPFQNEVLAQSAEVIAAIRQQCLDYLIDQCLLSTDIQHQMIDWKNATAQLTFETGALQADRFYIQKQSADSEPNGDHTLIEYPVDEYGVISIIGFGNSDASTSINGIQSFTIFPMDDREPIEINIDDPITILKGMNRKQSLTCNPVAFLELNPSATSQDLQVIFDFQQIMQSVSSWEAFAPFVSEVLTEQAHGSLTQTTLSVQVPDLSVSGNLTWKATLTSDL